MKNDLFFSPCPRGRFSWYNDMKTWQDSCVRWHCMLMKNISWYLSGADKKGLGEHQGKKSDRCRSRLPRSDSLVVIIHNLPRPKYVTWALKTVGQIPQMRDRTPKRAGREGTWNEFGICSLICINCQLGFKESWFLVSLIYRNKKAEHRVYTNGDK